MQHVLRRGGGGVCLRRTRRGLWDGAAANNIAAPPLTFSATIPPPPPDYAKAESWFRPPALLPEGEACGKEKPEADCFYLAPTSFFGPAWNAAHDDAGAAARTEQLHLCTQASAFSGAARVFAPRYRQMSYSALLSRSTTCARQAFELAYSDVERAFRAFLAARSQGRGSARPFFIAGHSQGSMHCLRLLQEVLDGTDEASHLLACYAIGVCVPTSWADGLESFHPSVRPDQPRALVSWSCRGVASADDSRRYLRSDAGPGFWTASGYVDGGGPTLQTSPLTWRSHHLLSPFEHHLLAGGDVEADEEPTGSGQHLGAVTPIYEPPFEPKRVFEHASPFASRLRRLRPVRRPLTALTTDREVVVGGLPPKLARSDLGQGAGDLHPLDYTLWWFNLRANAAQRLAGYRAARETGTRGF